MKKAAWDAEKYATTSELLARGWTRRWLDLAFGPPIKGPGNRKLWPRAEVLAAEKHPAFAYMVNRLKEIASHARYPTPAHEHQAMYDALEALESGRFGPPTPREELPPLPEPAAAGWPKAERTPDALTLTWECGGKVVVPLIFLEALRQGLGETSERLWLAVNTVLTDWRCGRIKPTKMQWGRNYLLASVRNTLAKLQELEGPARAPTPNEPSDTITRRVLH